MKKTNSKPLEKNRRKIRTDLEPATSGSEFLKPFFPLNRRVEIQFVFPFFNRVKKEVSIVPNRSQ